MRLLRLVWAAVVGLCAVGHADARRAQGGNASSAPAPVPPPCGKNCPPDMNAEEPEDTMPHVFPAHLSHDAVDFSMHMNAYDKAGQNAGRLYGMSGVSIKQSIPYTVPDHHPAERRPCALDQVLAQCKIIINASATEAAADHQLTSITYASALESARATFESARDAVTDLKRAKEANNTLFQHLSDLAERQVGMVDYMNSLADLREELTTVKKPILSALKRIQVEINQTMAQKRAALVDFDTKAVKPSETKRKEILDLYDQLLGSLHQQDMTQRNYSQSLTGPVEVDIKRAEDEVALLTRQVDELRSKITDLLPVASTYSAEALAAAETLLSDAGSHYTALKSAMDINLLAYDKRAVARVATEDALGLIMQEVSDVMTPQIIAVTSGDDEENEAKPAKSNPVANKALALVGTTTTTTSSPLPARVRGLDSTVKGKVLVGLVGRFAIDGPVGPDTPSELMRVKKALEMFEHADHLLPSRNSDQPCPPEKPWSAIQSIPNLVEMVLAPLEDMGYHVEVALDSQTLPAELWQDILTAYRLRAEVVSAEMDADVEVWKMNQWKRRLRLLESTEAENYDFVLLTRPDLNFLKPFDEWGVLPHTIMYTWDELDGISGQCDVVHVIPGRSVGVFGKVLRGYPDEVDARMWGQNNLVRLLRQQLGASAAKPLFNEHHTCGVSVACQGRQSLNPLYYMEGRLRA